VLHLTMEDKRFVLCRRLDHWRFCAVVGDGPHIDRRRTPRPDGEIDPERPYL
jgi:hypothetical protein